MNDERAKIRNRPAPGFNMTPMIDVVFLLIIFFMLVGRFISAENVPLQLPKPEKSQAVKTELTDRSVINCLLARPASPATSPVVYSVGPTRVASLDELSARLGAVKAANPNLQVVIRADRRLPYRAVHAVMEVVAEHRIQVMNLVAHVGERSS